VSDAVFKAALMRSSAISIYFLGKQICYARSDLVERQYFTCSLQFRSRFGHPVYGAGRPILRNRMMPFFMQRAQPFSTISTAVQQTIHGVDHNVPITRVTTLNEQVARSITNQRLVAQLSMFFGLLAVFLSCIGIYGLMSYVVARRTNEIGIRMALGAERSHVRWLVMREIVLLVGVGIAIGVPVTMAGSRLVSNMLFGLRGNDPVSLVASVGILLLVAVMAGYLPARRASRVDPMEALRYE